MVNNEIKLNEANLNFEKAVNYEKGINGVAQDYEMALKHYIIASNLGHVEALCCIGLLYQYGKGLSKDAKTAIEYYNKARAIGSANAVFLIGQCYYNGIGVSQDKVKGLTLCKEAYHNKSPLAEFWFLKNTGQIFNE